MKVSIINKSRHQLPKYETSLSAGMDLCGDFSRIELVNGKPKKFFFDADVVAIGLAEDPDAPFVLDKDGNLLDEKIPTVQVASVIEIKPGGRCLIPTGLFIALPKGYEAQIRPRSGLALKQGLTVLNSPGTIDAGYRGEIGVIVENIDNPIKDIQFHYENSGQLGIDSIATGAPIEIIKGQRFAQLVLAKVYHANFYRTEKVEDIGVNRNGGFGSSGK